MGGGDGRKNAEGRLNHGGRWRKEQEWPLSRVILTRYHLRTDGGLTVEPPLILAHVGWTTGELLAAMDAATFEGPYDLVTLLIGVNNQFRGQSIDAYRTDLVVLLGRAVTLAGGRPGRVLMVSIPDYGVTPFAVNSNPAAISAELDAFNAVGAEEAGVAELAWRSGHDGHGRGDGGEDGGDSRGLV